MYNDIFNVIRIYLFIYLHTDIKATIWMHVLYFVLKPTLAL